MGESFIIFFAVVIGIILLFSVIKVLDYLDEIINALGYLLLGIVLIAIGIALLVKVGGWLGAVGIFIFLLGVIGLINGFNDMQEAIKNLKK
ncbi:MAG: hypothetical protein FD122_298 [Stygiobacter sp.]|nr:MAG: hypothetical protein FD122_298 [Stygiobacter sp.]KAF0214245.1 MAG: hypothetical protein FD178_2634 [Ignavibacteria bacterium]